MTIDQIDERRRAAGLTQKELCRRARVNETTYSQVKTKKRDCYMATLQRLTRALDAFEQEARQ